MRHKNYFVRLVSLSTLFLIIPLWLSAQNIAVTGSIKDKNEALIGVSVSEKGTSNGISTGIDGNYTLSVPGNATLEFSYLGYKTQSVPVNGRTRIDVVMEEDTQLLSEVVVIGYGTQRREAITGSVASMSGEAMRGVASSNISNALQGRVAGVEMSQTSSKPGAEMQIRIRGTRSLNATNDPLVVLDGIPFAGNLSDINPNEIKSIDILKDASATAIYGSRGANGVILVTTTKGQNGQKPRVTYNGYYGAKDIFARYDMMEGPAYAKMRKYADMAAYKNNTADESDDVNTDWQDLFYKTGIVQSHDLGISGGTEHGAYTFGVGYYDEEGVTPLEGYNRISLRASIDQEIGKLFRFGVITNNNYNVTEGRSSGGIYQVLQNSPIANPYNADGTWKRTIDMPADRGVWVYTRDIVEANKDLMLSQTKGFGSYNTIYGEVKIPGIEGLKYRANLGLNLRMSNGGSYKGEGINATSPTDISTASISNSMLTNWAIENLLNYDRTFSDVHQINAVAMYSAEQSMYNRSQIGARDIASHFQWYNLGQTNEPFTITPGNQSYYKTGLLSYMGRVMYAYDNRYMLSATIRSDASSRLAPGHQWHTYPAISAGWNISRESFMQDVDWVNNLKLRAGYGETSNQAIDPYQTLGLLSTRPYNFGDDTFDTGYYVSRLPNPNLGWEYSTTYNYGLDFTLLKNRLSGTFEYYVTNTKDILFSVNLPSTSGVGSYMGNIGETQNKGFELSLNGTILDNFNGWTWDAGINLYSNQNKIVALASGSEIDEGNAWFVGSPINVIYAPKYIGLWQAGDPYMDLLEPGGNVGMIKVEYLGDYYKEGDNIPSNRKVGDPVRAIDGGGADRQVIEVDPKFQGGFNTRVGYKGFDLNVIGAFKNGGILVSSLYSANGYLNMLTGRRGQINVDYWTEENTGAKYPKPGGILSGDNPKYGNTVALFDATYLKIRAMTLGYSFNQQAVKDFGIQNLRLYATVQNPFVFFSPYKDESGMDPETNSYGNENSAVTTGLVQSRILTIGTNSPSTRSYMFGVNITF
ncbi:MAG: TonB-dependent receptor [Dysgonamonadaceae bacterium]|jgi:TonB-linked SusC/RagA family outer membrane protein|nr:TonB-dependent receptor [Dysgonamonadaceae bacterium]